MTRRFARNSMQRIIKAIRAEGRITDRNISFEEVAEPRFAIEMAKELGYKVSVRAVVQLSLTVRNPLVA